MGLSLNNAAWLNRMLGAAAGVTITYTRGATTIPITAASGDATVGREQSTSEREGGPRKEWFDRDYLIRVSALSALGEPQEGDLITETINGVERSYKIMRPSNGERAWRFSDTEDHCYRVHTKRVK
ncbi:MAG: hypothetical protein U0791_23275 [Gemmataceae bacterium]